MGFVPAKPMQINDMDDDLRVGLWNNVWTTLEQTRRSDHQIDLFYESFWVFFLKKAVDQILPSPSYEKIKRIRSFFSVSEWYRVYDFLEFTSKVGCRLLGDDKIAQFEKKCNQILEEEFSGYRFVNGKITPITNELEIKEIEKSISQTKQYTSLKGANIHLSAALSKMADRKLPDYRNSIKESISAVEATANAIAG